MVSRSAYDLCGSFSSERFGPGIQAAFLVITVILTFPGVSAQAKYGGGSGTQDDPYLISTAEQMNAIGAEPNDWDGHFVLTADIDLDQFVGEQFNIIGNSQQPFIGVFDGNGHTISNLTCTYANESRVGLFSIVGGFNSHGNFGSGTVRNLILTDPNIDAGTGQYVGSLVGYLRDGLIMNCRVVGGRISGQRCVGGLIGGTLSTAPLSWFPEMYICRCQAATEVTGTQTIGGLIGFFEGHSHPYALDEGLARIMSCAAAGRISGQENVGGLVGVADYMILSDCYSQSYVLGGERVGGLAGVFEGAAVRTCYTSGPVVGTTDVGGFVGAILESSWEDIATSIDESFWDIWQSGQTVSAGGLGATTAQMKQKATFTGWDFEQVWDIVEDQTYPFLRSPGADGVPGSTQ